MIKERLSAHYLYHDQQLVKHGIVLLDENRCVIDVIDNGGKVVELPFMRFLNGILLPIKDDSKETLLSIKESLDLLLKIKKDVLFKDYIVSISDYLGDINAGSIPSFALLKNFDYKNHRIHSPVNISRLKWLY